MRDENKKKSDFLLLELCAKSLKKNGFDFIIAENSDIAAQKILSIIKENKKVGFGGSITSEQLALKEKLSVKNKLIYHKPEYSLEQRRQAWLDCMDSDFYIASPQAITLDGKMIFIDGNGNRCAAVTWGPKHIIIPAGINKLVKNEAEGFYRMRNTSAIANNIRLSKKNPCVISGKCEDCSSQERICNIVTSLWKKPKITDYTVILINEELGY